MSRESDRFPGFGSTLIEQSLVCPLRKDATGPLPTTDGYNAAVTDAVIATMQRLQLGPTRFGPVLLVDAASVRWDSPLLLNNCPRSHIPLSDLQRACTDRRADGRRYWAAMLVFEQYLSTATVFLRPYIAGRSACCEISITLLGPPVTTESWLHKRLLRLKLAADHNASNSSFSAPATLGFWAQMLNANVVSEAAEPSPHSGITPATWMPRDEDSERGLFDVRDRLLRETAYWVGNWTTLADEREYRSYVLTPDVFGRMDVKAGLRSLYLQVSDAVLSATEDLGFDVSGYRDDKGRLTISAEKIDSLVVGETITMRTTAAKSPTNSNNDAGKTTKEANA